MEIKFTDNNNKEFTVVLKDEEVQFFVEYAMADLLKKGVLSLENPSEEEVQLAFLKAADKRTMPEA